MKDKKGNLVIVGLRSKNTRINMPMLRFREKKGTIAGEDREGSDVIRDGLLNFYHQNEFDPVASGNSTKGFWRDLRGWEVKLRNGAVRILVCRQRSASTSFTGEQILKKYVIGRTLFHTITLFRDEPDHQPDFDTHRRGTEPEAIVFTNRRAEPQERQE